MCLSAGAVDSHYIHTNVLTVDGSCLQCFQCDDDRIKEPQQPVGEVRPGEGGKVQHDPGGIVCHNPCQKSKRPDVCN